MSASGDPPRMTDEELEISVTEAIRTLARAAELDDGREPAVQAEPAAADEALIRRYLIDALDPVELMRFNRRAEDDPAFADQVDAAWEAAVARDGLAALPPRQGVWSGCFSTETLAEYADDQLTDDEAARVSSHLACARCAGVLSRLAPRAEVIPLADRQAKRAASEASEDRQAKRATSKGRWAGLTGPSARRAAFAGISLIAASVAAIVMRPPSEPPLRYRARGGIDGTAVHATFFVEVGKRRVPLADGDAVPTPVELGIEYVNRVTDGPVYFAAVLVDAADAAHWLVPDDMRPGVRPWRLEGESPTDARFESLWSIPARPGPASVRWRFATAPFDPTELVTGTQGPRLELRVEARDQNRK